MTWSAFKDKLLQTLCIALVKMLIYIYKRKLTAGHPWVILEPHAHPLLATRHRLLKTAPRRYLMP